MTFNRKERPPFLTQQNIDKNTAEGEGFLDNKDDIPALLLYLLTASAHLLEKHKPEEPLLKPFSGLNSNHFGRRFSSNRKLHSYFAGNIEQVYRLILEYSGSVTLRDMLDSPLFEAAALHSDASVSLAQRIKNSIESSSYRWRTARGIAGDLDIDEEAVYAVLVGNKQFICADVSTRNGARLFTTRRIYNTKTTPLRLLGDFLTGKVTI